MALFGGSKKRKVAKKKAAPKKKTNTSNKKRVKTSAVSARQNSKNSIKKKSAVKPEKNIDASKKVKPQAITKVGVKDGKKAKHSNSLYDTIKASGYVSEEDLEAAHKAATRHGSKLSDELMSLGVLTPDLLGQLFAERYKIPYADINTNAPHKEVVLKAPENIANKYRAVPFQETDSSVIVATDKPKNKALASAFKKFFKGKKIIVAYSLSRDIDTVLLYYRKPLHQRLAKAVKKESHIARQVMGLIFEEALVQQASDIHLEPQKDIVEVRLRVDGVLKEVGEIPKEHYSNIINRIKVKSHMHIDEHFDAQDGAMSHDLESRVLDMRVSIVPTLEGEKVAIRLLAAYVRDFTLFDLGLSERNQQLFKEAAAKPFGMILITGPTGSGKTTSLYAVLKTIHKPEINITTIEDPVEYKIRGINQIQVNNQSELTFAKGLRSIVRQDPDVILVGEIRDTETAEIAVNAALTGHLLFSTFHANDAATSIPRLLDMSIEPFLLASTLELVVAQRLVRKICDHCKVSVSISAARLKKEYPQAATKLKGSSVLLYEGKGCPTCGDSGYKGRTAIFEFLAITKEIKELILSNPSGDEIWKIARKDGATTLFEDGLEKVKHGVTTIDEVMRVAAPQ